MNVEDILSITPTEWEKITGKNLGNYDVKGVFSEGNYSAFGKKDSLPKTLIRNVPENTEVILNYEARMCGERTNGLNYYVSGVALIPKRKG